MFQNQINNVFNEIKSYYSVLSSNKIHKIEKILSKNDLRALLDFCKSENNSIFQKIEGKLELLISLIDNFDFIVWTGAYDVKDRKIFSGAKLKSTNPNSSFYKYNSIEVEYDNDKCGFRLSCNKIFNNGGLITDFEDLNCDIILDNDLEII